MARKVTMYYRLWDRAGNQIADGTLELPITEGAVFQPSEHCPLLERNKNVYQYSAGNIWVEVNPPISVH